MSKFIGDKKFYKTVLMVAIPVMIQVHSHEKENKFIKGAYKSFAIPRQASKAITSMAKDTATKLIFFTVASCLVMGILMAIMAPLFPAIYKTSDEVKYLATRFIMIAALFMPLNAFTHASYFTLRSGGKTIITFLFDSVFVWTVSFPMAYCLTRFSGLNIIVVYMICKLAEFIKCMIGYILVKKGVWLENIVVE